MPSTDIYTLSLHDALPIYVASLSGDVESTNGQALAPQTWSFTTSNCPCTLFGSAPLTMQYTGLSTSHGRGGGPWSLEMGVKVQDQKSTRLNSSHMSISYAVHRHLHSFPTRRSSDLRGVAVRRRGEHERAGARAADVVVHHVQLPVHAVRQRSADDAVHRPLDVQRPRRRPVVARDGRQGPRSEEHTSELQSHVNLVCRPPTSTLFPYTTLFRSTWRRCPATWRARTGRRSRRRRGRSPRPTARARCSAALR